MSQFDASIPVLTEVLRDDPRPPPAPAAEVQHSGPPHAGQQHVDTKASAEPAPASRGEAAPAAWPYRPSEAAAAAPAPEPAPVPEAEPEPLDWPRLERDVSERVLQQLTTRVDFVLEQRIRDSMEEVLAQALRSLTDEIRAGLHDTIGKIVTRAVQQEITHLQASTNTSTNTSTSTSPGAPRQTEKR